jgi:hypothetical protein
LPSFRSLAACAAPALPAFTAEIRFFAASSAVSLCVAPFRQNQGYYYRKLTEGQFVRFA